MNPSALVLWEAGRCSLFRPQFRSFMLLACLIAAFAAGGPRANWSAAMADDVRNIPSVGVLSLRGTVQLADGSPAANARIISRRQFSHDEATATTRSDGSFELTDDFGLDARLQARSADGMQQTTWRIPASETRTVFERPVVVTLQLAVEQHVRVTAQGRPVEKAYIVAQGFGDSYREIGMTGPDGRVTLRLPANEKLERLSAWHPALGIKGREFDSKADIPANIDLELLAVSPHTFRFLDLAGRPVKNLEFTSSVRSSEEWWSNAPDFQQTRLRTGDDGSITAAWFPEDFKYADIDLFTDDWHLDQTDNDRTGKKDTIAHVRPQHRIQGRLDLPEGLNAAGLLIRGRSFGPGDEGHLTSARARADGGFSLRVCSEHCYYLSVVDSEWASDEWTGVVLAKEDAEPANITIPVYPATRVEVQVARGPKDRPIPGAWVSFQREQDAEWTDALGNKQSGTNGNTGWLQTDENGMAHVALGRGFYNFRLSAEGWSDLQQLTITESSSMRVRFHHSSDGPHQIQGQLLVDGVPFIPGATTQVMAWGMDPISFETSVAIEQKPDPAGAFTTAIEAKDIYLFARDAERNRSAFLRVEEDENAATLNMVESGSVSGRLVDSQQRPLAGLQIALELDTDRKWHMPTGEGGYTVNFIRGPKIPALDIATTDSDGNFTLVGVEATIPLRFCIFKAGEALGYADDPDRILLQPGETRGNEIVRFRRPDDAAAPLSAPKPLAGRLQGLLPRVHASGMHALIVLEGDVTSSVKSLVQTITDDEKNPVVLKYLPMVLTTEAQTRDAKALATRSWPVPEAGEVTLVAINGTDETLDAIRLPASNEMLAADSMKQAVAFMTRYAPPTHDAHQAFKDAKTLAAKTDRRIWLISGGPRCNPCLMLGVWLDQSHELLEKDYVVLKVGVCDEGAADVMRPYEPGLGIPWFVILDAEGNRLITSDGPLGNIGFPSSIESRRHLRDMLDATAQRLTPEEKSQLIESLKDQAR